MPMPDLNLLVALDVLLTEGSVARAAERLKLSPSAMSRTLARLRETTGDPILVRAGRGLVATPRALELRRRVGTLVEEAEAVLRPVAATDPKTLTRAFTLRTRDGFIETLGPALLTRLTEEAPHVRIHFVEKPDKDSTPLRDGTIDLETGVLGEDIGPEIRAKALFHDRFVTVVREGHPLTRGEVTSARYAAGDHVLVSRRARPQSRIDDLLAEQGLTREITVIVGSFSAALALTRTSDLIATVPEIHTRDLRRGTVVVPLPIVVPEITISLLWHPRLDADPAHRWFRALVHAVCAKRTSDGPETLAKST
ncbi:LysR family transcriptional regulator [Pinisolibacter aquiterrae]|uniref:LysR family transcriptional regulator n=1 Tax=Pinisolibacter aquiterrae TaxID=2815579 RepID=UPI001C3C979A|nr:LysR family transcriptional regulator [Pinisolibacter aquiterrae]MBV5266631.1 LysR family transcriptional regulator [Pinisolibacter aquiterrae]MCC8235841.1 LysR family transcriptional regulator [Pinisolibacter aquiterrae]